jgi:deazaflavin-dependent oxidoreductase (nitroreductase family)
VESRPPDRPSGAKRGLLRLPIYIYRWGFGRLLGNRFLLLTHIGRRTGKQHQTVLEIMEYRKEGPQIVVMSAFGPNAEWLRNIQANPNPEVIVGSQRFVAFYRILDKEEAVKVVRGYKSATGSSVLSFDSCSAIYSAGRIVVLTLIACGWSGNCRSSRFGRRPEFCGAR